VELGTRRTYRNGAYRKLSTCGCARRISIPTPLSFAFYHRRRARARTSRALRTSGGTPVEYSFAFNGAGNTGVLRTEDSLTSNSNDGSPSCEVVLISHTKGPLRVKFGWPAVMSKMKDTHGRSHHGDKEGERLATSTRVSHARSARTCHPYSTNHHCNMVMKMLYLQ